MADPLADVENNNLIKGVDSKGDGRGIGPTLGQPDDDTYEPSEIEATRGRQQGLGVGAKDLERQRDPTGAGSDRKGG